MTTYVKLLSDKAKLPTRGSEYAAGYDLYAAHDATLQPGECVKISTDIAIQLPPQTFGGIFARSGLATKKGLRPINGVGVIDEDYRGPVVVALYNDSNITQTIDAGERVAQLIAIPYMDMHMKEMDELTETLRGKGGFGSTGTK